MKILPNLLTADSGRANFPLHGGIYRTFFHNPMNLKVPKKEPCVAISYTKVLQPCIHSGINS